MQQPLIVLDCERMRHPNTGLYHYCWQLATALHKLNLSDGTLALYLPQKVHGQLHAPQVLQHHFWHKFILPVPASASLWHCTYQGSNYFPKRFKGKIVLTVHDLNFLYDPNKSEAKRKVYLAGINAKLRRSDAIVAISEYVKQDLLRFTVADPAKICVVYNGCNFNDSIVPAKPDSAPAQPFLFTIGTITDKKNFHVLPRTLIGNNYLLVIAGIVQSAAYKEKIILEAKRLGVADRLIFAGAVTEAEKAWFYKQCAAFVFPSLSEGFGLPVIEAMYFGKPVVLSRATSLPEVGGAHAYYFDDFDEAHMCGVVENAIEDVHLKAKTDDIKGWAAHFKWENTAADYAALYKKLLL